MGLLDWLRRTFLTLKRDDPRFGSMTFQRMGGDYGPSYWEGSGTFAGHDVEFFVDGEKMGPTEAQRAVCDEFERDWMRLEQQLVLFLERNATDEEFGDSSRRLTDWSLGSIAIPAVGAMERGASRVVEIGYVEVDGGELLTFEVEGREPRALRVGG